MLYVAVEIRAVELFECSGSLEPDLDRVQRPSLLGESASPFIGEGDGLTS